MNILPVMLAGDPEDRLTREPSAARAVHQYVDAAEFAYAPIDQRVGDLRVRRRTGLCDRTFDAFRGFGGDFGIAPIDHHARTLGGEQLSDRQADTARASDDDGAAPGQRRANRRRRP
jgi:hypothetical protein